MRLNFLIILTVLLAPLSWAHQAFAQEAAQNHVRLTVTPEFTQIEPGATLFVAIRQDLDEGWHTYWHNPGDSGEPPRIRWHLPEGFSEGPLHWPVPVRIPFGPLTNYGYEGQVTLLQEIRAPAAALPAGPLEIAADIDILVCKDICIPEYHKAAFTLNDGSTVENSAIITEAMNLMPVEVDWPASYSAEGNEFILDLAVQLPGLLTKDGGRMKFDILPFEWGVIANPAETRVGRAEERLLRVVLRKERGERPLENLGSLAALVTYENLDDGTRHALQISAEPDPAWLAQAQAAPADAEPVDLITAAPETASAPAAQPAPAPAPQTGFAAAILFALIGGLILNLMPCVFPILSMKALGLVKMNEKSANTARLHGIAYTGGILACFAAIAALLIVLQSGGAQIGWGFQLQNPLVVLLLAYLLFVLGLNLSGFYEFGGSLANLGGKWGAKAGLAGSFFTGILATIVATPCTAPFMGVAMGYALTQPPAVSLTVFLALGLGLALPYLTLSFFPALRRALPKPGPWMAVFRELLAFPLYASAIWLIWVYSQQTGPVALLYALSGFVGISFAVWIFRYAPAQGAGRLAMRGLAILVLLTVLLISLGESLKPHTPPQEQAQQGAQSFTAARYAALQAGDGPLFVNMTAAWCITCKVNERVALDTDTVKSLFAAENIAYLKGDWTSQNPEITEYLSRYGRNGVPLYVFYGPRDGGSGARPAPVVLPQLLTTAIVTQTIKGEN